jgi:hypothetical protein
MEQETGCRYKRSIYGRTEINIAGFIIRKPTLMQISVDDYDNGSGDSDSCNSDIMQ